MKKHSEESAKNLASHGTINMAFTNLSFKERGMVEGAQVEEETLRKCNKVVWSVVLKGEDN